MPRPVILFSGGWADVPLEELAARVGDWGYQGLELLAETILRFGAMVLVGEPLLPPLLEPLVPAPIGLLLGIGLGLFRRDLRLGIARTKHAAVGGLAQTVLQPHAGTHAARPRKGWGPAEAARRGPPAPYWHKTLPASTRKEQPMDPHLANELAALPRLTVAELRGRYAQLFGEVTRTGNKRWLVRRLAWRLQTLAEGGLSQRARQRAAELANDADLRLSPPRAAPGPADAPQDPHRGRRRDPRLPPAGTVLVRPYKGQTVQVRVLADGLTYDGQVYPSLSAVAQAITGAHCNGYLFFRLPPKGAAS